jgi:hypothetical protein
MNGSNGSNPQLIRICICFCSDYHCVRPPIAFFFRKTDSSGSWVTTEDYRERVRKSAGPVERPMLKEAMSEIQILLVEDSPKDVELILHALKSEKLANRIGIVREEPLDYLFRRGEFASRPGGLPKLPPAKAFSLTSGD